MAILFHREIGSLFHSGSQVDISEEKRWPLRSKHFINTTRKKPGHHDVNRTEMLVLASCSFRRFVLYMAAVIYLCPMMAR
jgi:hypothetical protein